jgi:hypothetical protein
MIDEWRSLIEHHTLSKGNQQSTVVAFTDGARGTEELVGTTLSTLPDFSPTSSSVPFRYSRPSRSRRSRSSRSFSARRSALVSLRLTGDGLEADVGNDLAAGATVGCGAGR